MPKASGPIQDRGTPRRSCRAALIAVLILSGAGAGVVGCTTAGRLSSLLPDEVAEPMEKVLPIGMAQTLAAIEPFAVIQPTEEGGLTFVQIDEATHRGRGAMLSVNQGPWTTEAILHRGDVVDVTFTREASAGTMRYTFYGPTTAGFVRLVETRWYYDGYPETRRSLRVRPYAIERRTAAVSTW